MMEARLIHKGLTLVTFTLFMIIIIYNFKQYFLGLPELIKIIILLGVLVLELILAVKFFMFKNSKKVAVEDD